MLIRPNKKVKYNLIFVCDTCLKELIIPNGQFNPFDPGVYRGANGWDIPSLVTQGYIELTSSSVVCYCPEHGKDLG